MGRNSKTEAQLTRGQIIDAALELFSQRGYSRTTFEKIASSIDLSKGAVHWYFKTKTDLLVAVMHHGIELHQQAGFSHVECSDYTLDQLRESYLHSIEQTLTQPALQKFEFFVGFQIEWSGEMIGKVNQDLRVLREDPLDNLAKILRQLGRPDSDELAFALAALWKGAVRIGLMKLKTPAEVRANTAVAFDLLCSK